MKELYTPRFYSTAPLQSSKGFATRLRQRVGFTLTEVVLAVGVLSLAIVALVGLFGPTMSAVKDVVDRSGALAVTDHLNAQLLSDEIYVALGLNESAEPFKTFAGQLMSRSGDNVTLGTGAQKGRPGVLYAWKQFDPDRDKVGNVHSLLWPTLEADSDRSLNFDISDLDGSVYLVLLEQGLQQVEPSQNRYTFPGDVETSAYFPILVSIYEVPISAILDADGGISDLSATVIQSYGNGERGTPLFQYTTAKLR